MSRYLTTWRDLIRGFADAINLINPELQDHHERVSYLSYRLAEALGMDERQRMLAFAGGLLHDIGGILNQSSITLSDLEKRAGQVAAAGAALLHAFPFTSPFAPVVQACQTPWQHIEKQQTEPTEAQRIGQLVHLADAISLILSPSQPVLNQLEQVRSSILRYETEFSPEALAAFTRLCGRESVWMDAVFFPQFFLELIPDNRRITAEETVRLTEFMSRLIDFRSPFTAMHSAGVAATATALAELTGMSGDECRMMRIAGHLHDIGKLKIPNSILEKPGKLTAEEFNVMKEHTYYTWILLRNVKGFEQITAWASDHHEKLDGSGYPFHRAESELPLGSRIMTVADIFTAVTEDRPYRKSMDRDRVIGVLRGEAERGKVSEPLVNLLIMNYDAINARRDADSRAASRKYQESLAAGKAEEAR